MSMETAAETAGKIRSGGAKARDVTESCLSRIEEKNAVLGAFLHVFEREALRQADEIDEKIENGEDPGSLAGLPVAVKANICIESAPTTCGSKILEHYRSPYSAHAVELLKKAGAVIIGSTNMDEFAMGSSGERSAFFPMLNPHDTSRVPGGSSGGSAAAVASGMAPLALGTDTGGSVRQPASFCGVVGLKPTYGLVSRRGLVAFASSFDQIGAIAAAVGDAFMLLGAVAGKDPGDSTSLDPPPDFFDFLEAPAGRIEERARGLTVGVVDELLLEGCEREVLDLFRNAVEALGARGMDTIPVRPAALPHAVACYYIIAPAEASSNLARYDGSRYGERMRADSVEEMYASTREAGLGIEVKRRIAMGTYVLSRGYHDAYYMKAQKVRRIIAEDLNRCFNSCDVMLLPSSPSAPWKRGERLDDPLAMYLADAYTVPASLAGLPAVSVPCGRTAGGLPVGVQVMAPALGEAKLHAVATLLESAVTGGETG